MKEGWIIPGLSAPIVLLPSSGASGLAALGDRMLEQGDRAFHLPQHFWCSCERAQSAKYLEKTFL